MKPHGPSAQVVQALCRQGLALHQAGRLEEAMRYYRKAVDLEPEHFEALHFLGALCVQTGRADEGVAVLRRAIGVDPRVAEAHGVLGAALGSLGRHAEALASYDRVVALNPRLANAHYNRAIMLQALGRPAEALASYDRAAALNPNHANTHYNRGGVLQELGRSVEALASYDKAIALNPNSAEDHYNRGLVLSELGRPEEALASYDRAIALKPDYPEAHSNRGAALSALKRDREALVSFDQAIALTPDYAEAHSNRAAALHRLQRPQESLASCDRAIALQPDIAAAHGNRGTALCDLKRIEEALASFGKAIALEPDQPDAHVNRGFALLLSRRFEAGWREHEWRRRQHPEGHQLGQGRPWLGEPALRGKRLLAYHEQGLGDTIQFSRYVPLLERMGAEVVLSVQAPLKSLLRQLSPTLTIIADGEASPAFDYHCPLLSLPLALGTTLESIPAPARHLVADDGRRARFAARLGPRTRPRIGIAWSGSPTHDNDQNRSIRFEQLGPLLGDDMEWISLHKDIRPGDAAAFGDSGKVAFHGDELGDFSDTAALVELMDLVVTVDTSVAHLAGAMGKPVWILLPFLPDWRWMLDRGDSPWYPSARLFRQGHIGDWAGVIEEVVGALRSAVG